MQEEIIVSIDVETFGPIPGVHSMVNLGAVAYDANGKCLGEFTVNLNEQQGTVRYPETMQFWQKPEQAKALAFVTTNPIPPKRAMEQFREFLQQFNGENRRVVLLARPSGFDFLFVYWYWQFHLKEYPFFWFNCIDLRSYAAGKLSLPYSECSENRALKAYWPKSQHEHTGLADAKEQAAVYFQLSKGT